MNKPTIHQILAWAAWVGFLLFSVAACLFAHAEKRDPYFIAHYQNQSMGSFTRVHDKLFVVDARATVSVVAVRCCVPAPR